MLELGISQAQSQFTKILSQATIIIDKKSHSKKAVILPYNEYLALLSKKSTKENLDDGVFSKFVGVLENDFKTNDAKYIDIVK